MQPERRDTKTGQFRWWKELRVNMMYWRFRHVTRNRLRLQSWLRQHRMPRPARSIRPRASRIPRGFAPATTYRPHYHSARRSWIALLVMVALLTALSVVNSYISVNGTLIYALSTLVIVGAIYWAMRGT